jgi:hypothetical protein
MASDPVHDFDFFFGRWQVQHTRRKAWLANNDEWFTFTGRCTTQPLLDGRGNLDDNVLELPAGTYRAVTLRSFDPASRKWAIWWLDGRSPHALGTPMIGGFADDIGTFFGDDLFNGKPIACRFLWSAITEKSCRWEQAYSPDGGRSWETNWKMEFTRVA